MPIVDPEIIKSGEKELFSSILASLDEFQIEKLFKETHNLLLKERMRFKGGKTIAYKNQIAYKFFFDSVAEFSVLLDERGRFKGFTNLNNIVVLEEEETESYDKIIDPEVIRMRKAEFFDSLSASISHNTITELLHRIYNLEAVDKAIFNQGDIKIFNGHVTYQLLYDVNIIISILIDRQGNYISTSMENVDSSLTDTEHSEKTGTQLEA